jgi:hypothetical protein
MKNHADFGMFESAGNCAVFSTDKLCFAGLRPYDPALFGAGDEEEQTGA